MLGAAAVTFPAGRLDQVWFWATIVTVDPLTIHPDGDAAALSPADTTVPASALAVGQRVWVQQSGRRRLILGTSAGAGVASQADIAAVIGPTQIDDWNEAIAPGFYYGNTFSANSPPATHGHMGIVQIRPDNAWITQIAVTATNESDERIWIRGSGDTGQTWDQWVSPLMRKDMDVADVPITNSNFEPYTTTPLRVWRHGPLVMFMGSARCLTPDLISSGSEVFAEIPPGFRPVGGYYSGRLQGSGQNGWYMQIDSSGNVTATRYGPGNNTGNTWMPFSVMFFGYV